MDEDCSSAVTDLNPVPDALLGRLAPLRELLLRALGNNELFQRHEIDIDAGGGGSRVVRYAS